MHDLNAAQGTHARANTVTFSGTSPRSYATSPPSTPPATRQLNFIFLQEAGM
jgi:hypothetical protein